MKQDSDADPPNLPARTARPHGAASLGAAVRGSEPSARLPETLALVDRLAALSDSRDEVFRTIEQLTGLRLGELQALEAVDGGADHPREVARRTGQTEAAATATCDGLVSKGLLGRHHHRFAPHGEPGLVHVTTEGKVALGQVEGLQVRLADAVIGNLDDEQAERIQTAVSRAGRRMGLVAAGAQTSAPRLIAGA